MELRRFTDKGVEAFRRYLKALRSESAEPPPRALLTDPSTSQAAFADIEIEQRVFSSRLDAARYFDAVFDYVAHEGVEEDVHLWSWLSLFYFDQVCPALKTGRRNPGRDYRHIPEPGYPYGHRHLLGGAYMVYTLFGFGENLSRLLLATKVSVESRFHHELAVRQNFITNRGILEAADMLYFNHKTQKPKRGAQIKKGSPGTLFRFIDVIQQLEVTYDLYSMTGSDIVGLLPPEFDPWKGRENLA